MGAWIETLIILPKVHSDIVAPHVGAWIETLILWKKSATG